MSGGDASVCGLVVERESTVEKLFQQAMIVAIVAVECDGYVAHIWRS